MTIIIKAIQEVFSQRLYLAGWLLLSIAFFFVFFFIQVGTVPGNDFLFQLQIFSLREYLLLAILASFASLSCFMQWHSARKKKKTIAALGSGVMGGLCATVGSIFGSATCASCIAALFSFLGAGTLFVLLDWRNYIVAFSFLFLATSIYLSSRRIMGTCRSCSVSQH